MVLSPFPWWPVSHAMPGTPAKTVLRKDMVVIHPQVLVAAMATRGKNTLCAARPPIRNTTARECIDDPVVAWAQHSFTPQINDVQAEIFLRRNRHTHTHTRVVNSSPLCLCTGRKQICVRQIANPTCWRCSSQPPRSDQMSQYWPHQCERVPGLWWLPRQRHRPSPSCALVMGMTFTALTLARRQGSQL